MDIEKTPEIIVPQENTQGKTDWIRTPRTGIIGVFVALFILFAVGTALSLRNADQNQNKVKNENQKVTALAENTIIYGYWAENSSIIRALDLSNQKDKILATLPNNIKHVKVISPTTISYINGTDEYDHGNEIIFRNIKDNTEKSVVVATNGFGIDDYVVSPNRQYISTWELKLPSGSVNGGNSRVYATSLGGVKNLLYDDIASVGNPVRYPLAITNTGEVFTDKFLPNSGTGYGYGIEYSNFAGTEKEVISKMENGTYSTQPILSPDGTRLVFAGYDGSYGAGDKVENGIRNAILNPNTVEILDLATRARTQLVSPKSGVLYPNVFWDHSASAVIYSQVAKDINLTGSYSVNLKGNVGKLLPKIFTSLRGGKLLEIEATTDDSALGNLGEKYMSSISSLHVVDPKDSSRKKIDTQSGYIQFIALKGSNYFGSNLTGKEDSTSSDRQLQIDTFSLKPTLAIKREKQQSEVPPPKPDMPPPVKCDETAAKICNQLLGTDFDPKIYDSTPNTTYNKCFREQGSKIMGGALTTCPDSPLYLYGEEGDNVKVKIGTPIFSPNANYDPEKGFDITLGSDGKFIANDSLVESLSFDYVQALKKVKEPTTGFLVGKTNLAKTLSMISKEFGFNDKEKEDIISYAKKNLVKPFTQISFYDDATSKKILPIYFDPHPTNYINVVFYFKQFDTRPDMKLSEPIFEKIKRDGFTAIEISYILK